MINDKADKVLKEHFHWFLSRYQIGLETSRKGSDFVFDCVHLYCKCHKINLSQGGPYMDISSWVKNKKATVNPINKNDKCFTASALQQLH